MIKSASYSNRIATIIGRYGGTVQTELYRFLDVSFSTPMYARVDSLLCPAAADSAGQPSAACLAASASSCGNTSTLPECPDSSTHICLKPGQDAVRVEATNYTFNYFSIPVPACGSVLVYVRPIRGDPDLYLSQTTAYPTSVDYTWSSISGSLTPEWHAFCCGAPTFTSGQLLYAGVYAFTATAYDIYVRDIRDPLPITTFYPFANMRLKCPAGDNSTFECETMNPDPYVTKCDITQALPAVDENYSRLATDSNPLVEDYEFQPVSGLFLAYQSVAYMSVMGGVVIEFMYDIELCNGSFTNLYDSSFTPAEEPRMTAESFKFASYTPTCDDQAFTRVANQINQLGALYNNATSFSEFSQIQGAAKDYVTGDAWYGCYQLANNYLQASFVPITETTKRCTLLSLDPAFDSDPCCNAKAAFGAYCEATTKTYMETVYAPVKNQVESLCAEVPGCIYLSLSDYARFSQRETDPTRNCASLTQASIDALQSIPNLGLDYDCMARATGVYCDGTSLYNCGQSNQVCSVFHRCTRPCSVDADCAGDQTCQWGLCETPYESAQQIDATTKCMVDRMDTPLTDQLRTQWNVSTSAPTDTFYSVFRQQLARGKCRGGPELDDYGESDMAKACLGLESCNWGACMIWPPSANRTGCAQACLNKRPPFGPADQDHFCGVCQSINPESCFEISEWEGCYVRDPDVFNLGCDLVGAAFANDIEFECVFNASQVGSSQACLNSRYCPFVREERGLYGAVRTVCDGFCYDPALTNASACLGLCNASGYSTCGWTGQVCRIKDYRDAPSCMSAGASWWPTRVWKHGALQNQSQCDAGYCYPHLGLDQAACESTPYCTALSCPASSDGLCATEADCTASGFCSDQRELTHPDPKVDGVCVYSYELDENGLPGCPTYTVHGRKGCIDYSITDADTCLGLELPYTGTTEWMRPAANSAECQAHGTGCYEYRYTRLYSYIGDPGDIFLSPKNESNCLAVGGTPTAYYTWHQGSWISGGKWKPLQWKQRQWKVLNQEVVQDFSFEEWYYTVYPQAYIQLYFPVLKSDQYCRYNRIMDVLSKVSCSCEDVMVPQSSFSIRSLPDDGTLYEAEAGNMTIANTTDAKTTGTSSSPCTLEPKIMVGVSTLCTGVDFELDASPLGRLYVDKEVEISPRCVEGRAFSLSASQLQRNDPQFFFSDLYLRTLASFPSNFSIIENSHGVVVAQLIGDGAQFLFYDVRTSVPQGVILNPYKGNVTICLFKRADIALEPRFSVFGFATATTDLTKFSILTSWNVWTMREGSDLLICGSLPYPLPISDRSAVFPIYRAGDGWQDTTFYSSQPVATVFFFFFAVGLYALVLVANTVITGLLVVDYVKEDVPRVLESLSDTRWGKAWRLTVEFFDMPRLIHFLIQLITIDRILYFSMLPTGVLNDQRAVVYIVLGEVPIYLFFSIYTALVSFWVELVHFRLGLKRSRASLVKRIKLVFLGANLFMYCLLIALIIVFTILEYYAPSSDNTCEESGFLDGGPVNDYRTARQVLFIFYQCVVVLMALAISLGFLIYGTRLILVLYRTEAVNSKFSKLRRSKTIKFVMVMLVCTVALVLLCAFLLYATVSETVDAIAAIVFILIAEILPLALLTFSVGKSVPAMLSCCGRLDRHPTSGSSSASASAKKRVERGHAEEGRTEGITIGEDSDGDEVEEEEKEDERNAETDDHADTDTDDEDDGEEAAEEMVELRARQEPKADRSESDEIRM